MWRFDDDETLRRSLPWPATGPILSSSYSRGRASRYVGKSVAAHEGSDDQRDDSSKGKGLAVEDDDPESQSHPQARYNSRRPRISLYPSLVLFVLATLLWPSFSNAASSTQHTLSPRDLSKRAIPVSSDHWADALARRQTVPQSIAAENRVDVSISSPFTCAPFNVTWDPTKGTPPFTLFIGVTLWFPLAIVQIPETYADPTLRQWLYQIDLPQFQDGPSAVGNTPSIMAAIVDSTGSMGNTSAFALVNNTDTSCARMTGGVDFNSWSTGGPIQCSKWDLGWNITSSTVAPITPFILPEMQPPLLLTPPANLSSESDGTGGMQWQVSVPAQTRIVYGITDSGPEGNAGVGGINIVGQDQVSVEMKSCERGKP